MKTLTLEMIKSISIDLDSGFTWAEDSDGNNLFQACINESGIIDEDNLGHDCGVCGDYNELLGYDFSEDGGASAKAFIAAYKTMILDQYEKNTGIKMGDAKFAVIRSGYCVIGKGKTAYEAVDDANKFLGEKISIQNGHYYYCGKELKDVSSLAEDGEIYLCKDALTILSYQITSINYHLS